MKDLEAESEWLEGKNMIGIAAGASTPEWLIDKVKNIIVAKQEVSRGY